MQELCFFFFQAEDGIRDIGVTGVQTCALPISTAPRLRRVERYLAVAWGSGATPAVVLTKADLCDDVPAALLAVAEDAVGVDVLAVSSVTGEGLADLRALVGPGRTAAMVGPSGVGKSSLVNALAGRTLAATREIREA